LSGRAIPLCAFAELIVLSGNEKEWQKRKKKKKRKNNKQKEEQEQEEGQEELVTFVVVQIQKVVDEFWSEFNKFFKGSRFLGN
jgi:hypothetical protein